MTTSFARYGRSVNLKYALLHAFMGKEKLRNVRRMKEFLGVEMCHIQFTGELSCNGYFGDVMIPDEPLQL